MSTDLARVQRAPVRAQKRLVADAHLIARPAAVRKPSPAWYDRRSTLLLFIVLKLSPALLLLGAATTLAMGAVR